MSVYRPKNKRGEYTSPFYHYDFRLEGDRYCGSTEETNKRKAERIEEAIKAQVREEVAAARRAESAPLTWGAARDRYWDEIGQHHKGQGADNTEWSLDYLTEHIGRNRLLTDITPALVAEIVGRRRADGVANATVNRSVTEPLRKVLRRAAEAWSKPVPKIKWGEFLLEEPEERVREASPDEEAKLLAHMRPDYHPIFKFSLASGVRMSGLLNLQWSDIDWGNRTVQIAGKGGKNYKIPLSAEMRAIIFPLQGRHPTAVFTYAVQRTRGGRIAGELRPITKEGLKSEFSRARESAGIPSSYEDPQRGYRWHDNRHTRATRLLRKTGNLKMVQKLLGHKKIETTVKYAHVTMDDLLEALDAEHLPAKNIA
jgi:integrase